MIHRVQRAEEKKFKAKMISEKVQWYFQRDVGTMVPFDLYTNLQLEEALDYRQHLVKVKISNQPFHANVTQRRAMSADGQDVVELQRKDMKGQCVALSERPMFTSIVYYTVITCVNMI